jgi:prophage DNA circulation protein
VTDLLCRAMDRRLDHELTNPSGRQPMTSPSSTPQDKYLEALRQGQDTYVKAIQLWSDNVEKMLSGASSAGGQAPTPEQVIDNVFGFAEQLLAAQRDFAKRLLKATAPAVDAAQAAARPTTGTTTPAS